MRTGSRQGRCSGSIRRAMDGPHLTILAHPTGRLIGERAPYDVDMVRLIRAARDRGCFLELNAHPDRLDLSDIHCRMAKEAGVLISIATDAHRTHGAVLSAFRGGTGAARLARPAGCIEHAAACGASPAA